jgi:hypothetical protein
MSSTRFNARLDTSHHGPPHPFKDAGVVADSLTGIHNAMVKCLFIVNRICIHGFLGVPTGKNPEDSNLASVEAMQWVLLCLSIGHDIENISRSMVRTCRSTNMRVPQCFSTFVRPRPGKFFFIRRGPGPNKFTRKYLFNFI